MPSLTLTWRYQGTGQGGWGHPMAVVGGSGGGSGGLSTLCTPISTVKPGDTGAGGGAEECTAGTGAGTVGAAAAAGCLRALCPLPLPTLCQHHQPLPT